MPQLSDMSIEQHALALFFQSPLHIKALTINLESFAKDEHKVLVKLIRAFVTKYKSTPSFDTLRNFSNEHVKTSKNVDDVAAALLLLDYLPAVKASEAEYYFKKLENYRIGRELFHLHENFGDKLNNEIEIDFMELRKDVFKKTLHMGADEDKIERGFIYDNAQNRINMYKHTKAGDSTDLIPFGIDSFDNSVGKMPKKSLTLIYSKTGGGKTVFAINLAYNAAVRGFNVMYFTSEMSKIAIEGRFDSLAGELDSKKISQGSMSKEEELKYREILQQQRKDKLPLWVIHVPTNCTMGTIVQEIETYTTSNGFGPDLVVLDYANLIEPTSHYNDRSSKFDYLLKEMHECAAYYNFACITMMQESRIAALDEVNKIKNKGKKIEEDTDGVHNIGLSHHAADHCDIIIRLKWNDRDRQINRLKASIDKNRGGPTPKLELFCNFSLTYIGDVKQTIVYNLKQ